jgi:hypothetical protein
MGPLVTVPPILPWVVVVFPPPQAVRIDKAREAQIKSKLASVFTRDEFHMNFFTSSI